MADVFISYSRADGDFVRELHGFLTGHGKDVWVDWEDIPPAAAWEEDIDDSIDEAESFVFVVSGSSLASRYSLGELHHAQDRGKRIVPIACDGADPEAAPQGLRQLNWIWCRPDDDRAAAFERVLEALDTDLGWAEVHTRLLVRAVEWDERRDSSLLLRGRDLEDALQATAANAGKEPVPTELQREYLLASRRASSRRQRLVLGSVSLALAVSVGLGIVALVQRNLANDRARVARSQALAAQAVAALGSEPAAALADAVRAMETEPTPEARIALRRALLATPVAYSVGAEGRTRGPARFDSVAFGDGGRTLLGLGPDSILRIRESATGREIARMRAAVFAPEGRLAVAVSRQDAQVLDLRTGAVVATRGAPAGGRPVGAGFSREAPRAAYAVGGAVTLERLPAGRAVTLPVPPGPLLRVRFAADGNRAVTADGRRARVWDSTSGRLLATLGTATSAAISRDGRFVVTIGTFGDATLWRAGDGTRLAALGHAANVVFSRDGRLALTVAEDGSAAVWRTATGRQAAVLPGFGSLVTGVEGSTVFSDFSPGAAFSGDGRLVAVANPDGNVRIWDVAARKQVGAVGTGWANAVAFAPRGGLLAATAWNGELVVAPTPPSVPLRTGARPSTCVPSFDPIVTRDGRHVVAAAAGGAGVWTLAGRRVATLRPPAQPPAAGNVAAAAVSADGTIVAAASAGNFCVRYPRETHGAAVWRLGRAAPVLELGAGVPLGLDEDGRLLAAGGSVWPAAGGPRLPGLGKVLVLSPDGTRALVVRAGRFEIALTGSGETVATLGGAARLREALAVDPGAATFSPDGRRLLTRWGMSARLWDATTGDPIALLDRRGEEVEGLGFGDGGRLALVTFSGRAAVFSADDGRLLSSVSGAFAGGALSDDGAFAALPGEDGAIEIVDPAAGTRVALQAGTGLRLTNLSFGPGAGLILGRDEAGDVHVVRCEICAADEELLGLARSRLAVLARIEAEEPPVGATG